ncbi:MAG: hypothetical protein JKY61_06630 [Planctomycetes bacterium]|nr:hypothetical protein [Planctomycetota bacterium]
MAASNFTRGEGPLPSDRRTPHPRYFNPQHPRYAQVMACHDAALAAGHSQYLDPITGGHVETAESIWKGRDCCNLGCRHCPYLPR